MKIKHLKKNVFLHKLMFFSAIIAILGIAVFSVCASQQASAALNDDSLAIINSDVAIASNKACSSSSTATFNECNEDLSSSANWVNDWTINGEGYYRYGTNSHSWETNPLSEYLKWGLEANQYCDIYCYNDDPEAGSTLVFLFGPDIVGYSFYCPENSDGDVATWTYSKNDGKVEYVPIDEGDEAEAIHIETSSTDKFSFYQPGLNPVSTGVNVTGWVVDAKTEKPAAGNFVQYFRWSPWFGDYVPVVGACGFTDWLGGYYIEGIEEGALPWGIIRVYKDGVQIGESDPITYITMRFDDTIIMPQILINQDQPDPPGPVPPGPIPPGPVPPGPNPPEPVTPVPTPVDPGGGIAQTGDATGYAFAAFAMLALISAGVLASRKLYVK